MFCCYLLTLMMILANGQAYHFSQGWLPGRKRSPPAAVGYDVADDSTLFRLLQAEYGRRTPTADTESVNGKGPFTVLSKTGQPRTRLLRLVCSRPNKCTMRSHITG